MTAQTPGEARWGDLDRPPLRVEALRRALLEPVGPLARLDLVESTGSTNADLVSAVSRPAGSPDEDGARSGPTSRSWWPTTRQRAVAVWGARGRRRHARR